jgi:GT2 family glycosyltransferase
MRIAVVIASTNRAEELGQLLIALARQTKLADAVILSVSSKNDLPQDLPESVRVIFGSPGLPAQRNRGLDLVLKNYDIVVFYDDDFLPARDALENICMFFYSNHAISGATGLVLADGICGPGLSYQEALDIIARYEEAVRPALVIEDFLCAYGCNMAFRCTAIGSTRFDENLPRYAWQEDMDFAGQLSATGKVIRTNAFAGVHRGVKRGRSRGDDLGFSQIVNPVYLVRKGTMTPGKAFILMARNLIANHTKVFWPEPYIDRWGRLRGNWFGVLHILHGKSNPMALPSSRSENYIF